jgi:hypothetical protein
VEEHNSFMGGLKAQHKAVALQENELMAQSLSKLYVHIVLHTKNKDLPLSSYSRIV